MRNVEVGAAKGEANTVVSPSGQRKRASALGPGSHSVQGQRAPHKVREPHMLTDHSAQGPKC